MAAEALVAAAAVAQWAVGETVHKEAIEMVAAVVLAVKMVD